MKQNHKNMRIYQRFYNMIVRGEKTIEIRVGYDSIRKIQVGDRIRFNDRPESDMIVTRITEYQSFEAMMSAEDHQKINPHATAAEQLKEIKGIFPPHKEKLGVFAIELRRPS